MDKDMLSPPSSPSSRSSHRRRRSSRRHQDRPLNHDNRRTNNTVTTNNDGSNSGLDDTEVSMDFVNASLGAGAVTASTATPRTSSSPSSSLGFSTSYSHHRRGNNDSIRRRQRMRGTSASSLQSRASVIQLEDFVENLMRSVTGEGSPFDDMNDDEEMNASRQQLQQELKDHYQRRYNINDNDDDDDDDEYNEEQLMRSTEEGRIMTEAEYMAWGGAMSTSDMNLDRSDNSFTNDRSRRKVIFCLDDGSSENNQDLSAGSHHLSSSRQECQRASSRSATISGAGFEFMKSRLQEEGSNDGASEGNVEMHDDSDGGHSSTYRDDSSTPYEEKGDFKRTLDYNFEDDFSDSEFDDPSVILEAEAEATEAAIRRGVMFVAFATICNKVFSKFMECLCKLCGGGHDNIQDEVVGHVVEDVTNASTTTGHGGGAMSFMGGHASGAAQSQ